ncbi:hypothetical protein [uncultured Chryseobacterium sp.]|uniref:hypothetical protein n=1 Tax=uncultured Chryseobacterium sp. TaxID=259322 RepID=UPI002600F52B|nr:hypothetical protein [uncultured Chryseobacterium sp.]
MKKKNLNFILPLCMYLWGIYTCYTIIITFQEFSYIQKVSWKAAENQIEVYSSRRSTTVTYNFIKDNIRISRTYPGIFEGINTWLRGIDEKKAYVDISFYLRKKDYAKIKSREIGPEKDILGNPLNKNEPVPFFGLRKIGTDSNAFLLWADLWKFNYKWWIFAVFLVAPAILLFLLKKMKITDAGKTDEQDNSGKIHDYIFWTLSAINIINFII